MGQVNRSGPLSALTAMRPLNRFSWHSLHRMENFGGLH